MAIPNQKKNLHLLWRAGFGPAAQDLASIDKTSPEQRFKKMLRDASAAPASIDVADNSLKAMLAGADEMGLPLPAYLFQCN